jgi:hypothetical protein
MYTLISQGEYNRLQEIYCEPEFMVYNDLDFKIINRAIFVNFSSLEKHEREMLISKEFNVETFFYDPRKQ